MERWPCNSETPICRTHPVAIVVKPRAVTRVNQLLAVYDAGMIDVKPSIKQSSKRFTADRCSHPGNRFESI
jgi:hypothetical protein